METILTYHGKEVTKDEIERIKNAQLTLGSVSSAAVTTIPLTNFNTIWSIEAHSSQKRLKCVFCDCINNKNYGTCDYCGAPLREEDG